MSVVNKIEVSLDKNKHHYVAIMAGGIGSRFWPISRSKYPKQFLDVLNVGETLLQSTFKRFAHFIPVENIFIVTFEDYAGLVKEQIPDALESNILREPSRKNTAPCVAYIASKLYQRDPDATLIVAPSDHLILDTLSFIDTCRQAFDYVDRFVSLLTLGIRPTYPNTGYGYIQYDQTPYEGNVYPVITFTEKPQLEFAKTFIASGDFLWNAGIFVWKVRDVLAAIEKYLPEMYEVFNAEQEHFNTPGEQEALERIYPQCVNISIDYGIMEKAGNVAIIPSEFGWSDLGTWNSAYENMDKDYLGNAVKGDNVVVIDATKNVVQAANNKLVVLQGLDEFVVVDTNDVLLICKKEKEQEIKDYMTEIKRNKGERFL